MRHPSHRPDRVAESVRQVVAAFLQGEARDPRLGFVTVTSVEMSRDLQHATVRVSVMGTDDERAQTMKALEGARGMVRRRLAGRLTLRQVPDVEFTLDRGLEHARRIDELLDQLRDERGEGS